MLERTFGHTGLHIHTYIVSPCVFTHTAVYTVGTFSYMHIPATPYCKCVKAPAVVYMSEVGMLILHDCLCVWGGGVVLCGVEPCR